MKPGSMPVECPTCGAMINLPVNLTLGPVVDGNVNVTTDVDVSPAWNHWEAEHSGFRLPGRRYGRADRGRVSHIMQQGLVIALCGSWMTDIADDPPYSEMCRTCTRIAAKQVTP